VDGSVSGYGPGVDGVESSEKECKDDKSFSRAAKEAWQWRGPAYRFGSDGHDDEGENSLPFYLNQWG
jgi:hypothetical protein